MAHLTRRDLLKGAAIGGAAIALASVPALSSAVEEADAQSVTTRAGGTGPIVAYVHNPAHDEVTLMVGTRKVVIRDRRLVARMIKAAR